MVSGTHPTGRSRASWRLGASRWTSVVVQVLALVAVAFCGMPSANASGGPLTAEVSINGRDVATASTGDPIRLSPNESVDVVVEMTNTGTTAVAVNQIELNGQVLGLNFFNYATTVTATVPAGSSQTLDYRLNMTGLSGQATGLIGTHLVIKDASGNTLLSMPTVTDVQGSLFSVYGLFGIALVALTALSLVDAAVGLARRRLSANRWQRGVRLLTPGVGIGLVIGFSASVLRLWVPDTGLWIVVAGLTAVLFFAIGYFSPTPDDDDEFDDDDDEFDDFAISDLGIEEITVDELRR